MMLLILAIVVALVAWALRLMEQAVKGQEFSLMLAGFLVASSAAAMMGVYFLMGNYVLYMHESAQVERFVNVAPYVRTATIDQSDISVPTWLIQTE